MAQQASPGKGAGVSTASGIQPTYPATGAAAHKGGAGAATTFTHTEYRQDSSMQTDSLKSH